MEDFKHSIKLPARFVDMDAFDHINNANFLTYFEEARIKYLYDVIRWKYTLSKEAIILARAEIDFKFPAQYQDDLRIYTRCIKLGNKSFTLEYKLVKFENGEEKILASAITVLAMYNYEILSSIPVPESWKDAMKNFEGGKILII